MLSGQTLSDWFQIHTQMSLSHASRRGAIYAWAHAQQAQLTDWVSCVSAVSGDALLANFCLCDTNSPERKKERRTAELLCIYKGAYKNKYLICGPRGILRSALFAVALQQPTWEYFAAAAAPSTVGKSDKLNGERERGAAIFLLCARVICMRAWVVERDLDRQSLLWICDGKWCSELILSSQRREKNYICLVNARGRLEKVGCRRNCSSKLQ